jgi:GxxExxY protein
MDENDIGKIVVDTALKIHKVLGPGLLESVYEVVLAKQLRKRGLDVSRQVQIPVVFDGDKFDEGFRADIVVNDIVILELKSVENVHPLHLKQVQTYLKLSGCRLGFLLNFNVELMKNGIRRCVNRMPD